MKNFRKLITTLSKKNNENFFHIFLIPNQTSAIVTRLIISVLELKKNNYLLVPLRKTDTTFINGNSLILNYSILNRFLIKFFKLNILTKKLLNYINKKNKSFLLYSSWAYFESLSTPSVEKLISSKYCKGHLYIEEGQLSYRHHESYSGKLKDIYRTNYIMDSKYIYRDDALGFIGLLSDAFPGIPSNKKFIIKNYNILKKFYKPKIKGIKTIGLTCAERRLKKNEWELMIQKLINKMPNGGLIKLHPSFSSIKNKRARIESIIKKINSNSIGICPDNVIIEIEMLYENKTLIGSLTSLNRYAKAFGSKFIDIKLY